MSSISVECIIYFEDPFWIGIFEKHINGKLSVCRIVFGPEPKDYEVFEYILTNYSKLKFSPEVINERTAKVKVNPKRIERSAKKQVQEIGIGTKSQQALKLQQEENKTLRKIKSREQKEIEKAKLFSLKQQKKREKHKGR